MSGINRIRTLSGVGVLANRAAGESGAPFLRYNLVYGFNGSGKTTLSRAFSCLQAGALHQSLPPDCNFEFELADGTILRAPDRLGGLEERVCVFNSDFVERNLRWAEGTAASIFYVSEVQVDAAAALRAAEIDVPIREAASTAAETMRDARSQALATLKRNQARAISGKLHIPNRKYEAPALTSDYERLPFDNTAILTPTQLDALEDVARSSSPPPPAQKVEDITESLAQIIEAARSNASVTVGETMIKELSAHPEMVPWARTGNAYHSKHDLEACLFCAQTLTQERKAALAAAFNDALSQFIAELDRGADAVNSCRDMLEAGLQIGDRVTVTSELKQALQIAGAKIASAAPLLTSALNEADRIYSNRRATPTRPVTESLPTAAQLVDACQNIRAGIKEANEVIERHNKVVSEFAQHQDASRQSIRKHFLAEGVDAYKSAKTALHEAEGAYGTANAALGVLRNRITELRTIVREHGPAADRISKLVRSYLGHGELTVVPATEGYELHRHGRLVKGPPSEGEKTALALCYFLSTLGADGRKVEDLIVVVDDPISSLDSKAMNYACALILSGLREAKQLFVLTHNQHCMNEFKKFWKSLAYPKDPGTSPTATLLFLDVKVPTADAPRIASLGEMSKLLRDYDSEYHFLCMKILEFESVGDAHSEYGYLMPNVIRRVLELFLAFKVPGTSPIKDKLDALCRIHAGLDKTRLIALERLSQVESHSDTLEDFVAHSSITIEECRDANAALLELMVTADENHIKAIRKQCRVT